MQKAMKMAVDLLADWGLASQGEAIFGIDPLKEER
jgi:hypothetical protein